MNTKTHLECNAVRLELLMQRPERGGDACRHPTVEPDLSERAVVSPQLARVGQQHFIHLVFCEHGLPWNASGLAHRAAPNIQEGIVDGAVIEARADTSNCKINGHFSIQNHRFSGAILHSFCIFNRKSQNTSAIYIAIRSTVPPIQGEWAIE